jgi:hypothetical protein
LFCAVIRGAIASRCLRTAGRMCNQSGENRLARRGSERFYVSCCSAARKARTFLAQRRKRSTCLGSLFHHLATMFAVLSATGRYCIGSGRNRKHGQHEHPTKYNRKQDGNRAPHETTKTCDLLPLKFSARAKTFGLGWSGGSCHLLRSAQARLKTPLKNRPSLPLLHRVC